MATAEKSWVEGPHVQLYKKDLLQLSYLHQTGVYKTSLAIDPAADLIFFQRDFPNNTEEYYTIKRSLAPAAAEHAGVERMLFIGDMHGHFHKLLRFLRAQAIIDQDQQWSWGKGHLVLCGDVMDRGLQVLPLLWFLCKLEQQATAAGGAVHVLLGNHELMVMQHDFRYVHPQLMRLYAGAGLSYGTYFGPDWYLGQWLRSRNVVIRLNHLLIAHAGISPQLARLQLPISQINQLLRAAIDKPYPDKTDRHLLLQEGPLWYRGYVYQYGYGEPANQRNTEEVLLQYGATQMIVAHTPVPAIKQKIEGLVWAVDLDIESPEVQVQGLLVEGSKTAILLADGSQITGSAPH